MSEDTAVMADVATVDRDASGRWVSGANHYSTFALQFRNRLYQCVKVEDFDEIISQLVNLAKRGNMSAIQELLTRLMGKPNQIVELTETQTISKEETRTKLRSLLSNPTAKKILLDALHDTNKED